MTTIDHANYFAGKSRLDPVSFARSAMRLAYHALKVRSERAALHEMPDYLLKDIGIGRSEIDHFTSMRYAIANSARSDASNAK